jgi:hypothetical protein
VSYAGGKVANYPAVIEPTPGRDAPKVTPRWVMWGMRSAAKLGSGCGDHSIRGRLFGAPQPPLQAHYGKESGYGHARQGRR